SDAGFAPAASLTSATDGPRLIAGEPAETVVAEGEFEERIRMGAADIGSTVDGGELDAGDPPADAGDHRPGRVEQPQQTLGPGRACEEDPRSGETGHDEEDLGLLGQEPSPRQTPARMSHRVMLRADRACAPVRARRSCCVATTAATMRVTSSASGLLKRNISATTGETAKIAAAPSAAACSRPRLTCPRSPNLVEWA